MLTTNFIINIMLLISLYINIFKTYKIFNKYINSVLLHIEILTLTSASNAPCALRSSHGIVTVSCFSIFLASVLFKVISEFLCDLSSVFVLKCVYVLVFAVMNSKSVNLKWKCVAKCSAKSSYCRRCSREQKRF